MKYYVVYTYRDKTLTFENSMTIDEIKEVLGDLIRGLGQSSFWEVTAWYSDNINIKTDIDYADYMMFLGKNSTFIELHIGKD